MRIQGRSWDGSSAADRSLGAQLRAGLARIHQHGIIQNDVKPENILVEHATGRPVFVDFALARHSLASAMKCCGKLTLAGRYGDSTPICCC